MCESSETDTDEATWEQAASRFHDTLNTATKTLLRDQSLKLRLEITESS